MMLKDRLKKTQIQVIEVRNECQDQYTQLDAKNAEINSTAEMIGNAKSAMTACNEEQELSMEQVPEQTTLAISDGADDNPFGGDTEDASAVDAIRDTIDPDPEKLPFIANSKNPRAGAVGDIVTDYITSIAGNKNASLKDLAKFGKDIVRHCLKHQIGAAGKDNRAKLYLRTLEGRQQMEQEAELMSKESMFGKRR